MTPRAVLAALDNGKMQRQAANLTGEQLAGSGRMGNPWPTENNGGAA